MARHPLDDVYAVLFRDAVHYKIRMDLKVVSKERDRNQSSVKSRCIGIMAV